jgi:hypothetical protein
MEEGEEEREEEEKRKRRRKGRIVLKRGQFSRDHGRHEQVGH